MFSVCSILMFWDEKKGRGSMSLYCCFRCFLSDRLQTARGFAGARVYQLCMGIIYFYVYMRQPCIGCQTIA